MGEALDILHWPSVQIVIQRLTMAWLTFPDLKSWGIGALLLLLYTLIALPLGFGTGFLHRQQADGERQPLSLSRKAIAGVLMASLLTPAISEELVFRVLLLPHPTEDIGAIAQWLWSAISLFLFVVYHPLNAFTFFPVGRKTFVDPVFLLLAALLGIVCTLTYQQSGSLWIPVAVHWLAVVVWLLLLGGYEKLYAEDVNRP